MKHVATFVGLIYLWFAWAFWSWSRDLDSFYLGSGRSRGRFASAVISAEVDVHRLRDGDDPTFRAADRDGGQSIGAGVPGREEMGLCGERWHLGGLERSEPLGRDNLRGGDEGKCSHGVVRKKTQVWALLGPTGRGRVHMPWRRHEVPLVQSLCGQNGGVTCRSGEPHVGTNVCAVEEGEDTAFTPVHGLRYLDPILSEGAEIDKVSDICHAGGRVVCGEDGGWSGKLPTMVGAFQGDAHSLHHARPSTVEPAAAVGKSHGTPGQQVSKLLAPHRGGREQVEGRASWSNTGFGETLHRSGGTSTFWMEGVRTMASGVEESVGGCGVLAGTSSRTSTGVVSSRWPWSSTDARRRSGEDWIAGRFSSFACGEPQGRQRGRRRSPEDVCEQAEEGSKEEKVESREGGVGDFERSISERSKRWRRRKRRWQTLKLHGGGVLRMVWRSSSRGRMQGPKEAASSMHHMQISWPSLEGVSFEEVKALLFLIYTKVAGNGGKSSSSTGGGQGEGPKEPREKKSRLGQELDEEDELIEGDRVEIGGELKSEQEYVANRIFKFIHHFSGKTDFLSMAILEEASERKMKVVLEVTYPPPSHIETMSLLSGRLTWMATIPAFRAIAIAVCVGVQHPICLVLFVVDNTLTDCRAMEKRNKLKQT